MRIEQLERWHLELLALQGSADATAVLERRGYLESLLANGPAYAGCVTQGVVTAVGMVEQNPGNFRCWAITDPLRASQHLHAVSRGILRFFAESRARRIETIVQVGNDRGIRWVERILGFKPVGIMHGFNEHGDAWLYERTGPSTQ